MSRRPKARDLKGYVAPLRVFLLLAAPVIIWEGSVRLFQLPELLLPRPSTIVETLWESRSSLLHHSLVTYGEVLIAFFVAAVVGVLLGMSMVRWDALRRLVFPYIVGFNSVPKVAFAPLLILWLGFGMKVAIAIGVVIAIFPIVMNTMAGLQVVEEEVIQLARSMGARPTSIFLKIRIPYALPHIISGFKTGLVLAMVGVVVGEFAGANAGLGVTLLTAGAAFNTALVVTALLILLTGSMALFHLIQALEKRMAWYGRELRDRETSIPVSA